MGDTNSVGSFIRHGWDIFWKRPFFIVGVPLVLAAVAYIVGMLLAFLNMGLTALGHPIIGIVFSALLNIGLEAVLGICILAFTIRVHDSVETVRFEDIWHLDNFWKYVGAYILYFGSILLGTILLVIPGIIASIMFIFAPYIAVDKGLSPMEAMRESARITYGNKWRVLVLSIAVGLLYLLGFVALIIGVLVAIPVGKLAFINAYRRLTAQTDAKQAPMPLSLGEKSLVIAYPVFFIAVAVIFFFISSKLIGGQGIFVYPNLQPAQSIVPVNATRMPFTVITMVNNSPRPATILGIQVQASKLTDQAGIKEIELVDEGGMQIGAASPLDSNNEATLGTGYMLLPMSSSTLVVAANIAGCDHACPDNGQNVSIAVIGVSASSSTISGPVPFTGATHIMNSPIKIGTVAAESASAASTFSLPNNQDVKFISTRFTAGAQEDLLLYSVRYKYVGTLDFRKLSNVQATIDGKNYPALTALDGTYATVLLQGGLPLTEGHSLTVTLHGSANTNGEQGKTVEFDVEDPADAYFVGQTYGYGVGPMSGTWMKGNAYRVQQ